MPLGLSKARSEIVAIFIPDTILEFGTGFRAKNVPPAREFCLSLKVDPKG